ncbi:hypothetical protein Vafri_11501 [Volvox africanus]|nr:hypothetical protein Vafri_11501 [Volvox africanus]
MYRSSQYCPLVLVFITSSSAGPSKDRKIGYDWAIISGGAPNHDSRNHKGCSSVSYTQNDDKGGSVSVHSSSKNARDFDRGGLWFFSRRPVDPEATAEMEEKAEGEEEPPGRRRWGDCTMMTRAMPGRGEVD